MAITSRATLRAALPQGRMLPDPVWRRRHRWILRLLWAHAAGLPLLAALLGDGALHSIGHAVPLLACGLAAGRYADRDRRAASVLVSIGLLTSSALLVHSLDGMIEAHFHFFVMIGVLTLYEDWLPFLVALAYVVLHHAVFGVVMPAEVYDHPGNPFALAALHAVFVLAAGVANVLAWRLNEDVRGELLARASQQAAVAQFGRDALQRGSLQDVMDEAVRLLRHELGVDIASVLEHHPDEHGFAVRAGTWAEAGGALGVPDGTASQAGATLVVREPIVVADWATENRFEQPPKLREAGTVSGLTVVIGDPEHPFGVLAAHVQTQRAFSPEDVSFAQSVANTLAVAVERWQAEEELRRTALHDPLTGLPNRTLFLDRLRQALARGRRTGRSTAAIFVDLDGFKVINDSLGHSAGDELLKGVAVRLAASLRAHDTVARFGGDELLVLCEDLSGEAEAIELGERTLCALRSAPFSVGIQEIHVTASVGVAVSQPDSTAESLVRDADTAMYRAKEQGPSRLELFDDRLRRRVLARLQLGGALRRAVDAGALTLVYQPIVALSDGEVPDVEALLRWQDEDLGAVSPADFIPVAEETGLIVPLGRWVLEQACRDAARWLEAGETASVCVNISTRQLVQPDFADMVAAILSRTGLAPAQLGLEITESVLMEQGDRPLQALNQVRAMGVRIILDDFGIGYSSLGYLKQMPIDTVKLDRSFIADLGDDVESASAAIVSAVVTMAHALELSVVGEGVETLEQADRLRRLGCAMAQGFFFARPVPVEELPGALARAATA